MYDTGVPPHTTVDGIDADAHVGRIKVSLYFMREGVIYFDCGADA